MNKTFVRAFKRHDAAQVIQQAATAGLENVSGLTRKIDTFRKEAGKPIYPLDAIFDPNIREKREDNVQTAAQLEANIYQLANVRYMQTVAINNQEADFSQLVADSMERLAKTLTRFHQGTGNESFNDSHGEFEAGIIAGWIDFSIEGAVGIQPPAIAKTISTYDR